MSDKTAEELRNELTEMTITAGEWREKCEDLQENFYVEYSGADKAEIQAGLRSENRDLKARLTKIDVDRNRLEALRIENEEKIEAAQQHCEGCIHWETWRPEEGECRIDEKRNPGMFDFCKDYKPRCRPQQEKEKVR